MPLLLNPVERYGARQEDLPIEFIRLGSRCDNLNYPRAEPSDPQQAREVRAAPVFRLAKLVKAEFRLGKHQFLGCLGIRQQSEQITFDSLIVCFRINPEFGFAEWLLIWQRDSPVDLVRLTI